MTDQPGQQLREQLARFVRRRVSDADDADDLLQEVLLRIVGNPGPDDASKVMPWVFAIARNRIFDYYRSQGRQPEQVKLNPDLAPAETEDPPGLNESLAKSLGELIDDLSPQDQDALKAVDLDGMSQKDFAASRGIDYTTAKSRVQRARKRLRLAIEECCRIELDRRGSIIQCEPRQSTNCC